MKETQKKKRKGRKKEGTAKHDSVLTFFLFEDLFTLTP